MATGNLEQIEGEVRNTFTSTAEEIAKSAAPQQVPAAAREQRFSAISLIKTLRTNESDVKTQQQREEHRNR
jgi:hypothetical protein